MTSTRSPQYRSMHSEPAPRCISAAGRKYSATSRASANHFARTSHDAVEIEVIINP
jgi:hypothetical protein